MKQSARGESAQSVSENLTFLCGADGGPGWL